MPEIVTAVLNGWGSSSRQRESRTANLVKSALFNRGLEGPFLGKRSMFLASRARRFRRFIRKHQSPELSLLCVGKSLGARNMVTRVLNNLPVLEYRKVGLLTIDPCWPRDGQLRPNCNREVLYLSYPVTVGINVVAVLPQDQQAGSIVYGENVSNVPLNDHDHISIVHSPDVHAALGDIIRELMGWI